MQGSSGREQYGRVALSLPNGRGGNVQNLWCNRICCGGVQGTPFREYLQNPDMGPGMAPVGDGRAAFQQQAPYKYVGAGVQDERMLLDPAPEPPAGPNFCVIATGVCALGFAIGFTMWMLNNQAAPVVAPAHNTVTQHTAQNTGSAGSTWQINPSPAVQPNANGPKVTAGVVVSPNGAIGAPPSSYHTLEAHWRLGSENPNDVSKTLVAQGPEFSAFVYLENAEPLYDKRVIFAAYVQTFADGCTVPTACDGQKGGNEFDLLETGFVGFSSMTTENDISYCEAKCGGTNCTNHLGTPGCTWDKAPAHVHCQTGDSKHCNAYKSKEQLPKECTWTDVQNSVSFCTQKAYLDPRAQDFSQLSANSYLQGKTGKEAWSFNESPGIQPQNSQAAWSVETPDGLKWGNRWIKIDLNLVGNQAIYTYHFFRSGPVSDLYVPIVGARTLTLIGQGATFDAGVPHAWVFSLWQYNFWGAIASTPITDGVRRLHFNVQGGVAGPTAVSGANHVGPPTAPVAWTVA